MGTNPKGWGKEVGEPPALGVSLQDLESNSDEKPEVVDNSSASEKDGTEVDTGESDSSKESDVENTPPVVKESSVESPS